MRSLCGPVARAALLIALAVPARGADHLLLTEFAVTPTNGEFVEIYNPTADPVDLSKYYLSDFVLRNVSNAATQNYWRIVDGRLQPDPGFAIDFLVRFPDGVSILPGQTMVISLHDDLAFADAWSAGGQLVRPSFELTQDGSADGVPGMVDPGPELVGEPLIQSAAGLSNGTECVVLFYWDGASDLVADVDVVQWSNGGTSTLYPNKTGVSIDGPDADTIASMYQPDTPAPQQVASQLSTAHDFGLTVSRIDFDEAGETLTGGNGLLGHDETSEDLSVTWRPNTVPSIGSPGEFGPPALLAGAARAADRFDLLFSRRLDPLTAGRVSAYSALQVLTPGGQPVVLPVALTAAALATDGRTVTLKTDPQVALALYEIRVSGVFSEDGGEAVAPGTRALVRGFNPGPDLRLSIPHRPFFPQLDGRMEISYEAPQGANVLLRVFDGQGREVLVMAEEAAPAGGLRTIQWDGRDRLRQRIPAGVYYLHLEIPATGQATVVPLVMASAAEEALR